MKTTELTSMDIKIHENRYRHLIGQYYTGNPSIEKEEELQKAIQRFQNTFGNEDK